MPLFLPSNLNPNFQEVISKSDRSDYDKTRDGVDFHFQINANGSCVRSYKLEILNGRNDADVPDDNILATFYGVFEEPFYNKDMCTITITDEQMESQNLILEVPKDYRWRIRLYEDEIDVYDDSINIQTVYGNTYVGDGHTVGTTKSVIWTSKINNDIVEDKYIQTVLWSHDNTNDFNPFYQSTKGDIISKGDIIRATYSDQNIENGL
jgi:hypothetical protein